MAIICKTAGALRFFGDDLDPDEVTRRLGRSPTSSGRKGDVRSRSRDGVHVALWRTGSWLLKVEHRSPGDLAGQIDEILAALTDDLAVWRDLSSRFQGDISCGAFMEEGNEMLELDPAVLAALADRGLGLSLDIYDPVGEHGDRT